VAQEGIARLEVALPVLAEERLERGGNLMSRVIVGVDPHKKSVTIEAIDEEGRVLATGRWPTDRDGYRSSPSGAGGGFASDPRCTCGPVMRYALQNGLWRLQTPTMGAVRLSGRFGAPPDKTVSRVSSKLFARGLAEQSAATSGRKYLPVLANRQRRTGGGTGDWMMSWLRSTRLNSAMWSVCGHGCKTGCGPWRAVIAEHVTGHPTPGWVTRLL
jgi:hypothetical protein